MASNKNESSSENNGEHQKPRFSLLQLFDPLISSQRKSTSPNKQNNINLGSTSGEIKTTTDDNQNNKTQPLLILEDSFVLNATSNASNNMVLDSEGNIVDSNASGKTNVADHQESSQQLQKIENILDLTNVTFLPEDGANFTDLADNETVDIETKTFTNLESSMTEKDHFYSALENLNSDDGIDSALSESNMSEGSDKISTCEPGATGEETNSKEQDSSEKQTYNMNETITLCTNESAILQENDMDDVKTTELDETVLMGKRESLSETNTNLTLDQEGVLLQTEKSDVNNMDKDANTELDILKSNELDKNDMSEGPRSVDLENPNLGQDPEIVHHHSEEPDNVKDVEMGQEVNLATLEGSEFGQNLSVTENKLVGNTVPDLKPDLEIIPLNSEKLSNINSLEIKEQDEFDNKETNVPDKNSLQSEKSKAITDMTLESGVMKLQSDGPDDANNIEIGKNAELNDSKNNDPDEGSYLEEDTLVNQTSSSVTVNSEQVIKCESEKLPHEKVEDNACPDKTGNDDPNRTLVPEQLVPGDEGNACETSGREVEQNTATDVKVEESAQLEHAKHNELVQVIQEEKNEDVDDESKNAIQVAQLQREPLSSIKSMEVEEGLVMENEISSKETKSADKVTDIVTQRSEVPQFLSEETTKDNSEQVQFSSEDSEIRPDTNGASIDSPPTGNDGSLNDKTVICETEAQLPQNETVIETKKTVVGASCVEEIEVDGKIYTLNRKKSSEDRKPENKFETKSVQKDVDMLNKSTEINESLLEPKCVNTQELCANAAEKDQPSPENLTISSDSVNKEILTLQENILELQGKIIEKDQEKKKFNDVLRAHEKKIREYYQQYLAEYHSRKEATQSLSNLESALYDLVEKYKKAKTVILDFQENENRYRAEIDALHENIKQLDEQYICLKDHSQKTVERANLENRRLKESYDEELMKQKAYVKRMEIKLVSTETNLAQKVRECEQLSSVLDQLTGKV